MNEHQVPTRVGFSPEQHAMLALLEALQQHRYRFVTVTPATHQRVVARPEKSRAADLRDALGWSRPFTDDLLGADIIQILREGNLLEQIGDDLVAAKVRVSSLGDTLFVHSAYPTTQDDAVFFGPDSYRFARLIEEEVARMDRSRISVALDIGTGAGVGAIVLKQLLPKSRVYGNDVNPKALTIAAVNAAAAHAEIELINGDSTVPLGLPIDLAVANPPYIIDPRSRAYRDGGELHGAQVSIDMVADTLPQLSPGGSIILYTGSAIVDGEDPLEARLRTLADESGRTLRYSEIDPDVFGEELEKPVYRDVERIALVAAIIGPQGA